MATTWSKIREATLGKTYDIDGAYGGQCWDYVMYVLEKYYGGKRINCTTSGYVKDIANNRKTNGILNYCTDVGLKAELKPGDICVWTECAEAPYSHIAIYDHDANGKVYFCGQNQGAGQKVSVEAIGVSGIIGVFRPKKGLIDETSKSVSEIAKEVIAGKWGNGDARKKALESAGYDYDAVQAEVNKQLGASASTSASKCPFKSSGTVEALYDQIRVRTSPSTSKGDTGSYYNKGMTLNYQSVVTGDGWYWAKYKSNSGETHYCALCKTDGTSKYWKQK